MAGSSMACKRSPTAVRLLRSSQQFPSNPLGKGGELWGAASGTCAGDLAVRPLSLSASNDFSGW